MDLKILILIYITDKSESIPSPSTISAGKTMEDYQLPTKFKRVIMDDAEINAINVCKLKQIMIQ